MRASISVRLDRPAAWWAIFVLGTFFVQMDAAAQVGAYSRMGFGARGIAMSNALVSDVSGAASAYYNPALAPFVEGQTVNGTVALMSMGRQLQFLEFATPLRPGAGVTAGLLHAGVSDIDGRDASGYHTEDYSTDEFAFFLIFGKRFAERVSAGVAFQIFRADYFEELRATNSIGIDAGVAVRATDALSFGLVVEDLLARYTWETSGIFGEGGKTTRDNFPTRIRLGASYALLEGRARIVGEYESAFTSRELRRFEIVPVGARPVEVSTTERLTRFDYRFRFGGEYLFTDSFALRLGVDQIGDDLGGVKPAAGFMIRHPIGELLLSADYAFVIEPYAVSSLHFVTLRVGL